jgi:hypothetical protein
VLSLKHGNSFKPSCFDCFICSKYYTGIFSPESSGSFYIRLFSYIYIASFAPASSVVQSRQLMRPLSAALASREVLHLSPGCNISIVLTSGPFLPSGRNSIFRANTPLLYSAFYYGSFSPGRNTSIAFTSSPLLPSGRDSIFRADTLLLYSTLYYSPFSPGRNTSVALASGPLLLSGYNSILQANTLLLYSAFYYCSFFSGRDLSAVLASCPFSWVASILLLLVTNLFLRAAPYYNLVLQLLLVVIVIPAVRTYPTSTKRLK